MNDAIVEKFEEFTADDVTDRGKLTLDDDHTANGKQSAIGSLFAQASRARRIAPTGRVTKSTAPHRKGGLIREWQACMNSLEFDA
jgi:hypothetical protein